MEKIKINLQRDCYFMQKFWMCHMYYTVICYNTIQIYLPLLSITFINILLLIELSHLQYKIEDECTKMTMDDIL